MPSDLAHTLRERVIVGDGGMGTMLQASGVPPGRCPEELNVTHPRVVGGIHTAYLQAGAEVIQTNTFGGTRIRLAAAASGDRVEELNRAGAAIARQAGGDRALVAGSMGPTGHLLEPYGPVGLADARAAFQEQARALAEGEVDFFLVETMYDLNEARAAVEGIQSVSDRPIVCTFSFEKRGRTMMGLRPGEAALALAPLGVVAVGGNCGGGPEEFAEVLRALGETGLELPLVVQPNAGRPQLVEGVVRYLVDGPALAALVPDFIRLGARLIGSCCGSTPAHTAAIAAAVRAWS